MVKFFLNFFQVCTRLILKLGENLKCLSLLFLDSSLNVKNGFYDILVNTKFYRFYSVGYFPYTWKYLLSRIEKNDLTKLLTR